MTLDPSRFFRALGRLSGGRVLPAAAAAVALILGLASARMGPAAVAQDRNQEQQAEKKRGAAKDPSARRGGKERAGRKRGRRGPARVEADEVTIIPVTQTVPVLGRMVPRQAGVVAARIAGPVGRVNVHVGDRVKKGDVLAVLVRDTLRWQRQLRAGEVVAYEGALVSSRARLAKARNELRRLKRLRRSAAFSQARFEDQQHEVDTSKGEETKAQAGLSQAHANLKLAEINLKNAEIRAPFPGVVIRRHTVSGAYVGVGAPVVTLLNDGELEIEADVPSTRLTGLQPGTVVAVELEDKSPHQAVVRAIVPDENPLARTRAVRLTPDEGLRRANAAANQSVLVHVPMGVRREVLSVHKDAVLRRGGAAVYVIKGGRAEFRRVRLGEALGGRFEVVEGLAAGELVIVRGNERIKPGQRVRMKGNGE